LIKLDLQRSGVATVGETVFTSVYIGNITSKIFFLRAPRSKELNLHGSTLTSYITKSEGNNV
jgi:hypothetical protein